MKNKLQFIIYISLGLVILIFAGLNIYKVITTNTYNNLINFANEHYPLITDNNLINFQFEFNPFVIPSQVEDINSDSDKIIAEITTQYLENNSKTLFLDNQINELLDQANTLSINITDNYDIVDLQYYITSTFNETTYRLAKERYNYMLEYQNYLKGLFTDYKQEKTTRKFFSNPLWGYTDADLSTLLSNMSDEDKAGQLLLFSITGTVLTNEQIQRYKVLNPGGVIIMGGNVSNTKQVQALTRQIQSLNNLIPLFIPTDQEGGVVKRISWDETQGQKYWVNMPEEQLCTLGKNRSDMLLEMGINMNFSPVVDLTYPGAAFVNNRTISTDPNIVLSKSKTYIDCSQNLGIITTLKHFPGHGSTTLDSHYSLPLVNKSKNDWLSTDAIPFEGNLESKQIMAGHLVYKQIDPDNPASLSKIFLTDILRNEWGYKGLIITDDMNMLHNSTRISVRDALKRAVNAGNDLLIYVGAPVSFEDVKAQLVDLIKKQEISEERINNSLLRILIAKRNLIY